MAFPDVLRHFNNSGIEILIQSSKSSGNRLKIVHREILLKISRTYFKNLHISLVIWILVAKFKRVCINQQRSKNGRLTKMWLTAAHQLRDS